jgi:adenine-specific DNA-methyltransferase
LADLGRYYLAPRPSMRLIYSTEATWPDVDQFPRLRDHLARFRAILDQRRETRQGRRRWWQLHWPREERTWLAPKIVALQMAARQAFAVATHPAWTPFSVNVLMPAAARPEDLHYLTAVLNSRLAWDWFRCHAKHRGVGLDINGHVLRRFPLRRLCRADESQIRLVDDLAALAAKRAAVEASRRTVDAGDSCSDAFPRAAALDEEIDRLVDSLYGVDTRSRLRQ